MGCPPPRRWIRHLCPRSTSSTAVPLLNRRRRPPQSMAPPLNRRRRGYSIDGDTSTHSTAAPLLNRRRCLYAINDGALLNRRRHLRRCFYSIAGGTTTQSTAARLRNRGRSLYSISSCASNFTVYFQLQRVPPTSPYTRFFPPPRSPHPQNKVGLQLSGRKIERVAVA